MGNRPFFSLTRRGEMENGGRAFMVHQSLRNWQQKKTQTRGSLSCLCRRVPQAVNIFHCLTNESSSHPQPRPYSPPAPRPQTTLFVPLHPLSFPLVLLSNIFSSAPGGDFSHIYIDGADRNKKWNLLLQPERSVSLLLSLLFLPRDSGNERAFLKKISIFAFLLFPSFLLLTLLSRQSETEEGKSKGKKKNKGKKQSAFRLRLDHGGKIFCHFFLPHFLPTCSVIRISAGQEIRRRRRGRKNL